MFKRRKRIERRKFHIPKKELKRLYYDLGWTQAQIGEHYGCGAKTISQRMEEYGLKARHVSDYLVKAPCEELHELYIVQELNTYEIAARYGCRAPTVVRWLRGCGIPVRPQGARPREHVPSEVLAAWPSHSLAYVVGLIAADGNLARGNYMVRLASTDYEMIQHYRACLQLSSSVPTRKPPRPANRKSLYEVVFSDRAYRAFLEKLGLTPAKSLTLRPLAIPDTVFPDFARGCWDGDGGWYIQQQRRRIRRKWKKSNFLRTGLSSSSPIFLTWMQKCIQQQSGLRGRLSSRRLRYNGSNAVALGLWMYYAPDLPALTRKRAVWEQFT